MKAINCSLLPIEHSLNYTDNNIAQKTSVTEYVDSGSGSVNKSNKDNTKNVRRNRIAI